MGYARSPFPDFESYLRNVFGLDENDIQFILKQYNSNFVTYIISPGIYRNKIISEVVYTTGDHEGTLESEHDDNTMKTNLFLTRFGLTIGTFRFDEKSFLKILSRILTYWDYKPTNANHADSPGVHTTEKFKILCTTDKIHLECDVVMLLTVP